MLFIEKCKEAVISVVPIVILVLLLHLTVAPLGDALPRFLAGAVLFIIGLGLSIAENIVKNHKGRIWAESVEGINTFRVELPMA